MQVNDNIIKKVAARILISAIYFYQGTISRLLGGQCRFVPSCSEYAREAIERLGAFRGTRLAVWRILRCNPFSSGGYDAPPAE